MNKILIALCLIFPIALGACSNKIFNPISFIGFNKQTTYQLNVGFIDGLPAIDQKQLKLQLIQHAPDYAITMSKPDANNALLRGYFSFEKEDQHSTNVYYVFDVLDRRGQRLYRTNGSLNTKSKITQNDFDKIAKNVLSQIKKWRQQNGLSKE